MNLDRVIADLGDRAGDMALQCSDAAGLLSRIDRNLGETKLMQDALGMRMQSLVANQTACGAAADALRQAADHADGMLNGGRAAADRSLSSIETMMAEVITLSAGLEGLIGSLRQVSGISEQIGDIARQTRTLGLNASIEAARGGEAAAGFAVVAEEVRRLAQDASNAAESVSAQLGALGRSADMLLDDIRRNATLADRARAPISEVRAVLSDTAEVVGQVRARAGDIAGQTEAANQATSALQDGLSRYALSSAENAHLVASASDRMEQLENRANDILNTAAHHSELTASAPYVRRALAGAAAITAIITEAITASELSPDALFDRDYAPIAGTEPTQYLTRFVPFADEHIRPELDRQTALDSSIVGCCLVDPNGFLPTHISERSQPQRPDDPEWTVKHSRNRCFFLDPQTRRALDGEGDYFVYSYRQDLGDGAYRALRSVFVPIIIGNRRWGLYELGYLI